MQNKATTPAIPLVEPIQPTTTFDGWREQILKALEDARKITDAALAAERELTAQEVDKVEQLLKKAESLTTQAKRADAVGKHFRDTAGELAQLFGSADRLTGGTKSARGGEWGAAVVRASSDRFGQMKALLPTGATVVTVPAPEPVSLGQPVNRLRSVIPSVPSTGAFQFLRQSLRENNAAVVAPGAVKETSIYEFDAVEDRCKTLAHISTPLHRADLSDAPLLQAFVDSELRWGLEFALEQEILTGDGTGEHFLGLANTPGIQTVALLGPTAIDLIRTLRRSLTRLENQGLAASAIVMNPSDYETVETLATTDGALLMASAGQSTPVDAAARRLFGVPVVATPSCPVGVAWVGDFLGSTKLWVRSEAMIDWSQDTYDPNGGGVGVGASDFQRNMIRFRVEGRFGFGVTRPTGIVRVALV